MKTHYEAANTRRQKVFQLIQADLILLHQLKSDGIQDVDVNIEIGHLEERFLVLLL